MRCRSLRASVFLLLAVAVPLTQLPLGRALAADPAQLRGHTGEATLRHWKAEAGPATPGPLVRRDEVQTHKGTATVDLHGGVTLELGAETLLAMIGGPGSIDAYLGYGVLKVTTAASHGPPRLVQISTPSGRVDMRANEAHIEANADRMLVQVVTGSAEIVGRQQRIAVDAGQEVELSRVGEVSGPRPFQIATAPQTTPPPAFVQTGTVSGTASPEPTGLPTGPQNTATPVASRPEKPLPAGTRADGPLPTPAAGPVSPPPALNAEALAAVPAKPQKEPFFGFTTLRLLREKNIISQGEFDSALRDMHDAVGLRGADSVTLVLGRWKTTLYGFVQADAMWHSTQSFNDFGSNFLVARPDTFAGQHSRMEASVRDSRIGVRVQAPEVAWFRASAVFELDLLGPTGTIGSTITETSFFVNPDLRVRHAYFKAETPIVDILFGQTWHLFGWQPNYVPTVIQWPGLVGELFARTTQLRISKTIKTKPVTIEMAVAGMRPPQRDSSFPEFQAGFRILFNKWTAVHTNYMTSTTTMPASIGISGDLRRYTLPEFLANPQNTNSQVGAGIAVNAYLPIIRATKEHKDNSWSLLAEVVTGQGINDLYTGLTGGVATQTPTAIAPMTSTFAANIDPGLAVYDINGNLQLPRWTTFVVGMEYYLPHVGGRVGLFANVSRSQLHDPQLYGSGTRVRDNEMFYNGGFFVDIIEAVRVGMDYGRFDDQYADGVHAINDSVQLSGFLFF